MPQGTGDLLLRRKRQKDCQGPRDREEDRKQQSSARILPTGKTPWNHYDPPARNKHYQPNDAKNSYDERRDGCSRHSGTGSWDGRHRLKHRAALRADRRIVRVFSPTGWTIHCRRSFKLILYFSLIASLHFSCLIHYASVNHASGACARKTARSNGTQNPGTSIRLSRTMPNDTAPPTTPIKANSAPSRRPSDVWMSSLALSPKISARTPSIENMKKANRSYPAMTRDSALGGTMLSIRYPTCNTPRMHAQTAFREVLVLSPVSPSADSDSPISDWRFVGFIQAFFPAQSLFYFANAAMTFLIPHAICFMCSSS